MHNVQDTIVAIATPPGRGGVGIVRISGMELSPFLNGICHQTLLPRVAKYTPFYDADDTVIDQGLALYFPAPHSFTGETVLELHAHGGAAVLSLLMARALALGARTAEPGEFTKRAYLNDKLDLLQAEAVADVIDAATTTAVRAAQRSLSGAFSKEITQLVDGLIGLRMLVESCLDFPEEELEFLQADRASEKLAQIRHDLTSALNRANTGVLLREGLKVVLVGPPNVGKSSLLNYLAREDVAIVTPVAGTTRDAIRQVVSIRGVPVQIIDTAGIRETTDAVEQLGIARTREMIAQADLALILFEGGREAETQVFLNELPAHLPKIFVLNKADLLVASALLNHHFDVKISAKTGMGLPALEDMLLKRIGVESETLENAFIARDRHIHALKRASAALAQAAVHLNNPHAMLLELFAEDLRAAQDSLGQINGKFSADDLLGEIFSRFCIGK